jgi:hypothetical protein
MQPSPLRAGNVSIFDGWSFVAGVMLVAAAAVFAGYFPARRASRVDPCARRYEPKGSGIDQTFNDFAYLMVSGAYPTRS